MIERLEFAPGSPVNIYSQDQIESVYNDVGKALVVVVVNENGQPKVNWEMTQEVIDERDKDELGDDYKERAEIEPLAALAAAGVSDDNIKLLQLNVKKHGDWLLNPEAIVIKVKEGFELSKLAKIGTEKAIEIGKQLGIKEEKPGS